MTAEKRFALIIANSHYEDAMLRKLIAPSQDAEALADVLRDPEICGFGVSTLIDEASYRVCEEIEAFFDERERDDLTLLYFSGHGVTDEDGLLYYAARNTQRKRLRSTAIAATWVNEMMSRCRSRRQVLLLDCCHSGAFGRTKAAGTVNVGQQLAESAREEGRGRYVLTASDAFQYSFEGESVEGQGVYSVFTHAVVEGLRTGQADLDSDGVITFDELSSYVHRRVREQTPQQSPRKWASDAEGNLVIAFNLRPAEAALPDDLVQAIESFLPEAREKAVPRLGSLLRGRHRGLAAAAQKALAALADDDSRRVSTAAQRCLVDYDEGSASQRRATEPVPAAGVLKSVARSAATPSAPQVVSSPPPLPPASTVQPDLASVAPPHSGTATPESGTQKEPLTSQDEAVTDPFAPVVDYPSKPMKRLTLLQREATLPFTSATAGRIGGWSFANGSSPRSRILWVFIGVSLIWIITGELSYVVWMRFGPSVTFSTVIAAALAVAITSALRLLAPSMSRKQKGKLFAIWLARELLGSPVAVFAREVHWEYSASRPIYYLGPLASAITWIYTGRLYAVHLGRSTRAGMITGGLISLLTAILWQLPLLLTYTLGFTFTLHERALLTNTLGALTGVPLGLVVLFYLLRRKGPVQD